MVQNKSQPTELEQRFSYLLQPIRDLTRNWNIDITSELENYLEEIESIAITFDGGKTTINFAEAAMVIQGSACVYSKKVEYLHNLVYQVLDLLASKKKLLQAASVDADGNDRDATRTTKGTYNDEFLSLDDIRYNKNIDLRHDGDQPDQVVPVLPRVTLSLIPLTDGEKGENPLLSHTGEILGSRNDFKMNTCNIHPSGTLLLDLSHLDLLDLSIQNKPSSTPFVPRTAPQLPELNNSLEDMLADAGQPLDVSLDDNEGLNEAPYHPEEPIPDQDAQCLRRCERNKNIISRPDTRPDLDPWQCHDPHQPSNTEKAFSRKKTFKLTLSLIPKTTKKRKRKNAVETNKPQLTSLTEFCAKAFYSRASQFPHNPLKIPAFIEFEDLFWEEYKLRQGKMRNERKLIKAQGRVQELAEEVEEEQDQDNFAPFDEEDIHRVDFQIPVDVDLGPMQANLQDLGPDDILDFEEAPVISSYEELVRRHVDGYLASAQQYAQITELSRRVAEWEEKILPKLQEEDEHEPFDIHKSGSKVIDSMEKYTGGQKDAEQTTSKETIAFRKVCKNKPAYEVCRLFLATLQLANTYNIEISSEDTLEQAVDNMKLRLLSTRRHYEQLEAYRAPSVEI